LIELYVKGDVERFESPDDFLERASLNALQRFDALRICVGGSSVEVVVTAARTEFESRDMRRGVTLEVRGSSSAIAEVMGAVTASITRGGFWFSREPRTGDTRAGLVAAQEDLHSCRRRNVFIALALPLGASALITLFALSDWWIEGPARIALPLVAVFLGLAVLLQWRPRWVDILFPAIDIADVTPGRRTLRQLAALPLVPAVTWLVASIAENA
jgi:hypothetical protein